MWNRPAADFNNPGLMKRQHPSSTSRMDVRTIILLWTAADASETHSEATSRSWISGGMKLQSAGGMNHMTSHLSSSLLSSPSSLLQSVFFRPRWFNDSRHSVWKPSCCVLTECNRLFKGSDSTGWYWETKPAADVQHVSLWRRKRRKIQTCSEK